MIFLSQLKTVSMHGTAQRWNSWNTYQVRLADGTPLLLKDWTNLHTYDDYSKFVFQYRTSTYSNELQKRRPQLVVCFGYNDGHERLFGVKERQLSLPDSFPCSGSETMIVSFTWFFTPIRIHTQLFSSLPFPKVAMA